MEHFYINNKKSILPAYWSIIVGGEEVNQIDENGEPKNRLIDFDFNRVTFIGLYSIFGSCGFHLPNLKMQINKSVVNLNKTLNNITLDYSRRVVADNMGHSETIFSQISANEHILRIQFAPKYELIYDFAGIGGTNV